MFQYLEFFFQQQTHYSSSGVVFWELKIKRYEQIHNQLWAVDQYTKLPTKVLKSHFIGKLVNLCNFKVIILISPNYVMRNADTYVLKSFSKIF